MPFTQGIPQNLIIHSTNPRCISVPCWSYNKVAKARHLLTLRHLADEKTSDAGTEAMTGMVCEASRGTRHLITP